MYIPKHFEISDLEEVVRFVSQVGAADLVTVEATGLPISTLMPCMWDIENAADSNYGSLIMHMARGNQQWKYVDRDTSGLVIVHGPQAYISPSNYEGKATDHKVVPTWNYQSVHLSGKVEISEDTELLREIVSSLTEVHEYERNNPWSTGDADPKYFEAQLNGIVAVILRVNKVEAKYKLSQNRSVADRESVVIDLERGIHPRDHDIASAMKQTLETLPPELRS